MTRRDEDHLRAQQDGIRAGHVAAWVFGLFLVAIVLIFGLIHLFDATARQEIFEKQLQPVSSVLIAQRAKDAERLGQYAQLDAEAGRYRIPIARAIELIAADPERLHAAPVQR